MEALPRALRLHHDVTGEAGLSPYHIMFGRDRNPPGIIYTPERFCENSFQFFKRMEHIDQMISQELNSIHAKESKRRNSHKPLRETYKVDDIVWVLKPRDMASQSKILPRWDGPLQITARLGAHTYSVKDKKGTLLLVHVDQLKPYIPLGLPGELKGFSFQDQEIDKVVNSREREDGETEYLVVWKNNHPLPTWTHQSLLLALGGAQHIEKYHSGQE